MKLASMCCLREGVRTQGETRTNIDGEPVLSVLIVV